MRAIIIGAGRGRRLMPMTANSPKCFAEVGGRRILDWTLDALRANGVSEICFVGGYRIDQVRAAYPELEYRHNTGWRDNNILESLFYAEDLMDQPFICCYSDILFNAAAVENLLASDADISLVVDTAWLIRYEHRTEHPSDDAEKVMVNDGIVTRVHRGIEETQAHGEYIGLAMFSSTGAEILRRNYHRCRSQYSGQAWREAPVFEKAYKIQLFQEMIENGVRMRHVDTPGAYIEIDTQQDFEYARRHWASRHLDK